MDASGDPAIRTLKIAPDVRIKAIKAINRRVRQIKFRLRIHRALLRVSKFFFESLSLLLRGANRIIGVSE